ncbi:aspartic peptidase A1 [Melampsora americana]|nr:aspartic peptidase A1 [Melampsora americana]
MGAVPDGSSPGTTSDPSSSLPSSNSSSSFSQKKLKALVNNLVTDPEDTTAHNSIGFSIHSNDIAYFATIKVGTPTQEFNVIMDSGSSDFWLSGPSCSNSQSRTSTCFHKTLSKSSSTFKPSNKPFQVTYGTGQVSGFLIQEDVEIAGLKLNSHTFGATTQESKEFASKDVPFDGLMGTALSTLSTSRLITPIESLAKNGKISGAFVGYALGRAGEDSNIGQVTIGGVDESKFEAPLTMFKNINQRGFWEGTLSSFNINGKPMISSRTTIFDTGTSLMIVPSSDAQKIHSGIPDARSDGQGSFLLPCNTNVKVSLIFEGKEFIIKSSDLAVQPVNLNNLNGMCLSGIAAGQIGGQNQWLLGDIFLKNVYFVTDATNNEIGLAVIKNNT